MRNLFWPFFMFVFSLTLGAGASFAAVGCDLNDPDRDVTRLFPESTGYKTTYVSIEKKGGEALLRKIERRLGDVFQGLFETIDVPYTIYEVLSGEQIIGYIHGVNQRGTYGGIQVFLALDLNGVIQKLYFQKLTSKASKQLRDDSFTNQFKGLSLRDFDSFDVVGGDLSKNDKLKNIVNPQKEAEEDFKATLRAIKKNFILVDEFVFVNGNRNRVEP